MRWNLPMLSLQRRAKINWRAKRGNEVLSILNFTRRLLLILLVSLLLFLFIAEKAAAQKTEDAAPAPKRPKHKTTREEIMPPNSILFVQNLPDETDEATLSSMFSQYVFALVLSIDR